MQDVEAGFSLQSSPGGLGVRKSSLLSSQLRGQEQQWRARDGDRISQQQQQQQQQKQQQQRNGGGGGGGGGGLPMWSIPAPSSWVAYSYGSVSRNLTEHLPLVLLVLLQSAALLFLLLHQYESGESPRVGSRGYILNESFSDSLDFVSSRPRELQHLTNLVIVAGHAVSVCCTDPRLDSAWWLLEYQRSHDIPLAILDHIEAGVRIAAADSLSLLMFTGGATREPVGPRTEAESYFYVADHAGWWGQGAVRRRTMLEEYARDSFENLLFGMARFREVTGSYPDQITVVGFDFKSERYSNLHRAALRIPEEKFHYVGTHPKGTFDLAAALSGEERTRDAFKLDPYGCLEGGELVAKRHTRNPFRRTPPYVLSAPEMEGLLQWCADETFPGGLPW